MSDDNKSKGAAGGRDISDLKARLGLKKGAGGAPAPAAGPGGGAAAPVASGPVPAPIPPPPGFAAPAAEAAPAAPAVDPRRDPFASQPVAGIAPAGAYYGYAPIPGIDDGQPATAINEQKPWGRVALIGGAALMIIAAGFTLGKIQWARANMNKTIDDAARVRAEVDELAKTLVEINDEINKSTEASKGNPDTALAATLGNMSLKKPDVEKNLFKTNYMYMEDTVVALLFAYYNDTSILYAMINNHAKKTEADKEAIENFVKQGAHAGEKNYGVTTDLSGPLPFANLVELGSPVCPVEGQTDCAAKDLKGFKLRAAPGGEWTVKPVKGPPGSTVSPLQRTAMLVQVMSGSPDLLAAKDCSRRLAEIRMLTTKLFNEQKDLQKHLETAADKKRKVNEFIVF